MKRFFDFPTTLILVFILAAIVAEVLSNPVNWIAFIWILIAAIWVVNARSAQMTAEDYQKLYNSQSKMVESLKKAWTDAVNEQVETDAKYQALDNEYLKLVKQHEATARENAQLHERVDDLRKQRLEYVDKYETASLQVTELTQQLEAKKPAKRKTGKKEYTEQDQARIQEEMKSVGMEAKKDEK